MYVVTLSLLRLMVSSFSDICFLYHLNIKLHWHFESFPALGCYVAYVGNLLTFRDSVLVPKRCQTTNKISCVTSQKSEGINYTVVVT